MSDNKRPFPLIADNEPVIEPVRQMQLYENDDLITRMKQNYRDKIYQDPLDMTYVRPERFRKEKTSKPLAPLSPVREVSKARETAKKDIKQKRQAIMDKQPMAPSLKYQKPINAPKKVVGNELSRYGKKLEQDTYILAELPRVYTQPQNPSSKTVAKNSYDFLKKSQVYNHPERQYQKERQVAQELNLAPFDD